MPAPNQPPTHLSTPSRQQTSNPIASVLEHGQSSDPHTASFSRSHETDAGPFTTVEDAPMGGDFHTSPLRSSQAPPAGQPSGGAEDPITLTALSSIVSTLVQKEDVRQQDVDLDALRALANAAVTIDSNIPSSDTSQIPTASLRVSTAGPPGTFDVPLGTSDIPPGTSVVPTGALTVLAGSSNVPTDVSSSVASTGVSSKGKSLMVKEDIPIKARIFKQMEEDRLEVQRKRQQDVIDSAMYYNEADWLNIRAQVEANASFLKTLLGDDVSEDNFPARMATLIKRKRQAMAEHLAKERQNRPMTQAQQKAYMR
nr:hypothetical protein [Tanacetum cinerariifolium]